ncbi:hypothetical protein QJR26_17825 (plasmid) [Clostridium baratii]
MLKVKGESSIEPHILLMKAYSDEYRAIEIIVDEEIKLLAKVTCVNGENNIYLIQKYIHRDTAVNKASDLFDKLIYLTKGVKLEKGF